tara:strand:- start:154 stop:642 length:489 start_codon:yes stop_codon:yes gene_type:complete
MNSKQNNFFLVLSFSIILLITACSSGGNRDIAPEPFNINNIVGDWFFSPNCEEYVLGTDTIYLSEQLPDTITINSDTDSTIFIDAGANNLIANVDPNGNFIIPNQIFQAYVDLGFVADTLPISLNGSGSFSSNFGGSMDLTFDETILTGAQIDCTIDFRKLD